MKKILAGIGTAVALTCSTAAMAVVSGNYTFNFNGNCVDCALAANAQAFPVTATLQVQNYELGVQFTPSNFVQFNYGGSNLLAPYVVLPENLLHFSGAINSNSGFFDITELGNSTVFQSNSAGLWKTGSVFVADFGDNGTWSMAAAAAPSGPVPEPATWAMMIVGFGMLGAAMRKRAKVTYSVA